jgi:hypothetical protein
MSTTYYSYREKSFSADAGKSGDKDEIFLVIWIASKLLLESSLISCATHAARVALMLS